jgi:hypothetical protein
MIKPNWKKSFRRMPDPIRQLRLNSQWAGRKVQFAVHAYLPENVEVKVEGWVVQQWWEDSTRPLGDGYYTTARHRHSLSSWQDL